LPVRSVSLGNLACEANIVTERETADALLRADAHLSTQPNERRKRKGTLRAIHADGGATR